MQKKFIIKNKILDKKHNKKKIFIVVSLIAAIIIIYYMTLVRQDDNKTKNNRNIAENISQSKNALSANLKNTITNNERSYTLNNNQNSQNESPEVLYDLERITTASKGQAIVSFIVTDVGMSEEENRLIFSMKNNITIGFMPYAPKIQNLIAKAQKKGFDTAIYLPTENINDLNVDNGPLTVSDKNTLQHNIKNINAVLNSAPGVGGIYLDENQNITGNTEFFESVIVPEIKKHDLYLAYWSLKKYISLKERNENEFAGEDVGVYEAKNGQSLEFNSFLDSVLDESKIKRNISRFIKQSIFLGRPMIGVIRSYPISILALKNWLKENENTDVIVVRMRALYLFYKNQDIR